MVNAGTFEIRKLYILGNGFDIHHDIKCFYKNFRYWLCRNKKDVFLNLKRLYRNINQDWWSDFEENLANFDYNRYPMSIARISHIKQIRYLEKYYGQEGRDFIDTLEDEDEEIASNWYRRAGEIARFEMQKLRKDLQESFGEWVLQLNKPKKSKMVALDKNAMFFTFNYTRTLEDLYGIKDDQVVHLHGSVDNKMFIIGHNMTAEQMMNRDLEENGYYRDPDKDKGQDDARLAMSEAAEEMKKPVEMVILNYGSAFNSLEGIKEIEILGLSYSPIDIPYMEEIFSIVGTDVKVKLGWHTSKDEANAEAFAKKMGLSSCEPVKF